MAGGWVCWQNFGFFTPNRVSLQVFDRTIVTALRTNDKTLIRPSLKNDILIYPNNILLVHPRNTNRRTNEFSNHRYTKMNSKNEIYSNIMKDLYSKSGWSPRPLETHNGQPGVPNYPSQQKKESVRFLEKLKGTDEKDEEKEESSEYSSSSRSRYKNLKKINELMLNKSSEENEESKVVFGGSDLPFQIPKRHPETFKKRENIAKNYHSKAQVKRNPIFVVLDIYPIKDNGITKEISYYHSHRSSQVSSNFIPFKALQPDDERNLMIIRVNLFGSNTSKIIKDFRFPRKARRKTFSFFSKHKKNKKSLAKKCSLIEIYAHDTPHIMKWKGKDGHWIYANRLHVKHLEEDQHHHYK